MKKGRVFLLWLTLGFGVGAWADPSVVDIDAKGGQLYNDSEATFRIISNSGSGSGITLKESAVTIDALHHGDVTCDVIVQLGLSELLKFNSVNVANAVSTLTFAGSSSAGLAPANETTQQMELSIASGAKITIGAPLTADVVRLNGDGDLYVSDEFVSSLTNVSGMVYFVQGETDHLGVRVSSAPFAFWANHEDAYSGELLVEKSSNGNRALTAELASDLSEDLTELRALAIGGGHDVTVNPNVTLRQYDVLDAPEDFLDSVPDCVVVGSNSVGTLRISGDYLGKLAIADGSAATARGAVYVAGGATVQNYSEVTAVPLLGRHGYAALDVAGTYTAIGCWQGGVDGQLFLKISDGGLLTHSSERTSGFSLGGSDARVTLLASGGTFNAEEAIGDVTLPLASDAAEVVLTAENNGLIELGEKTFTANSGVRVNLNSGGTLSANAVVVKDLAVVQFDGGYVRALQNGNPFVGSTGTRIYAYAGGAGYDVPDGVTAQIETLGLPRAPEGSSVTAIDLGENLEGQTFVAPPIVKISNAGGSGYGATAVAELTDGAVTAIRVTSPGVNYSSPAATLVYGPESGEIDLGAVTTEAVEAGPLLKRGEGTLEVNVATALQGLKIYGGRVKLAVTSAVAEGPLYMAEGSVLDIGSTIQSFSDFKGCATIESEEGGIIYLSALSVDMERSKTNDVDTLDLSVFTLRDGCSISLTNFDNLDRAKGRYVLYHLSGDLPEQLPALDEKTYQAGLSRNWVMKREDSDLVLRYIGGSLFIFY